MRRKGVRIDGRAFPKDQIRAKVILDYCIHAGYQRVVCLSQGDASRKIHEANEAKGVPLWVIQVSPTGYINTMKTNMK